VTPKRKTLFEGAGTAESFQQFLTDYTEFGEKSFQSPQLWDAKADTASIRGVWEGVGQPFMKAYEPGELTEHWETKGRENAWDRAFFTKGENWPAAPDTVHYQSGVLSDVMAEFAHAQDYDTTVEERRELSTRGQVERKLWGEGVYGEKSMGLMVDEYGIETGESRVKEHYPSYQFSKGTVDVPFTGGEYYWGPIPFGKTTMKEFIPGVTPREDIPAEMAAHSITEEELWWQLEPESGERMQTSKVSE
tara:strand:- start:146 stop:889 length:744 start_codon:yes stop_codon:yes gene_type:complete